MQKSFIHLTTGLLLKNFEIREFFSGVKKDILDGLLVKAIFIGLIVIAYFEKDTPNDPPISYFVFMAIFILLWSTMARLFGSLFCFVFYIVIGTIVVSYSGFY